jgi:hypothetical protein
MAEFKNNSPIPTVRAALDRLTIEQLKELLDLLPVGRKPTRKADLIAAVEEHLNGENLRALWERLDKTQRSAVAETLYSPKGIFEADRFRAKYGVSPVFGTKKDPRHYREIPSPLRLFIYREMAHEGGVLAVPGDLARRLLTFVPEPAAPSLPSVDEVPEDFELITKEYVWQEGDRGITIVTRGGAYRAPTQKPMVKTASQRIPLLRRDTERDAVIEVGSVLRLIDLGKVAVSEKTQLPGTAALREISGVLPGGDFYPAGARHSDSQDEIGPIKPFAWPLLVQAAGLAEPRGKKLALTKTGRSALGKPAAETLRGIWQRWLKTRSFDEFNRVDAIKSQRGKGQRSMTAPAGRRAVIAEALRQCPVNAWIKLDDFSRYMQATGYDFEITRNPWDLYIEHADYGSLGHAGFHDWPILQKRYLGCLLFEYAATLGLIDLAYVEPWDVPADYRGLWGADGLSFLSRYDGLLWFRLNPLGAFCLGLAERYEPTIPAAKTSLSILPSLQIKIASGALSAEEALILDIWAERQGNDLWRLDRGKILNAVENGRQITELRDFLDARDPQGLPDTVEGFLATTARQAQALKNTGPVLLIECADADIAELIAGHESTRSLCRRAGSKHLAVGIESEERFRKAVNGLGYGMPKV